MRKKSHVRSEIYFEAFPTIFLKKKFKKNKKSLSAKSSRESLLFTNLIAHEPLIPRKNCHKTKRMEHMCQAKNGPQAEQDRTTMTKRVQEIEASLSKKEELRISAQIKLARASELNDDARR